jgi:hypothetical protein
VWTDTRLPLQLGKDIACTRDGALHLRPSCQSSGPLRSHCTCHCLCTSSTTTATTATTAATASGRDNTQTPCKSSSLRGVAAAPAAHSSTPKLLRARKKELHKATHETTTNKQPLTQVSIHDYSYTEHPLPPQTFREPLPSPLASNHLPTTHLTPHPSPHLPSHQHSEPHAVTPPTTSQRHPLTDPSRVPTLRTLQRVRYRLLGLIHLSFLRDTRSSVVRLQPFFESVLFQ